MVGTDGKVCMPWSVCSGPLPPPLLLTSVAVFTMAPAAPKLVTVPAEDVQGWQDADMDVVVDVVVDVEAEEAVL